MCAYMLCVCAYHSIICCVSARMCCVTVYELVYIYMCVIVHVRVCVCVCACVCVCVCVCVYTGVCCLSHICMGCMDKSLSWSTIYVRAESTWKIFGNIMLIQAIISMHSPTRRLIYTHRYGGSQTKLYVYCLLYTSDAADE